MTESNNVIKFPVENRRLDLSNISTEKEEIMKNVEDMKKAFFATITDTILEDVLRSIDCLELRDTRAPTQDPSDHDIILIKESIIAAMCTIVGLTHPLHAISKKYISDVDMTDVEGDFYLKYRFRSENKVSQGTPQEQDRTPAGTAP